MMFFISVSLSMLSNVYQASTLNERIGKDTGPI